MPTHTITLDSLNDLVAYARKQQADKRAYIRDDADLASHGEWAGNLHTMDAVYAMARDGWQAEEVDTMAIAASCIQTIEQTHDVERFETYHDVAGSFIDMDAYNVGEPEYMVEFSPTTQEAMRPVVTICASVITSGAVHADSIKRRGKSVAALVFALDRLGYNTEVWTDYTGEHGDMTTQFRCLIKSANDMLDGTRILFALAHPASTRALHMTAKGGHPNAFLGGRRYSGSTPRNPIEDMEPGTIYLPCIYSYRDVPDAYVFVESHLRSLGILTD